LERTGSYLIPQTEDWISYTVKSRGFHFNLDKRVSKTMEPLSPAMRRLAEAHGLNAAALDFYIIHAGGPKILDDLSYFLGVPPQKLNFSRATLTEYGNVASVVVFDALRRASEAGTSFQDATGMIASFGPGITEEICMGRWA
jgi:1,3,6,8-tetrahydroxynaphthalene synthase